ncbi:unnamed protein product, partial [Rotaria sp. Silwood2]
MTAEPFIRYPNSKYVQQFKKTCYVLITKAKPEFVSTVEADEGIQFSNTHLVLENIGIQNATYDDCAIVQYVCRQVSKRAARLAAAGLAVLVNRIGKPHVTIGVDGSLY